MSWLESSDTVVFPENSSHGNPETHYTNDQGHVRRCFISKFFCGLWHTVCESWRNVFPHELKRGFYVEMGGLQLVSDLDGGEDLPDDFKGRVTIRGAIELARVGLLPEVSLEQIEDQSKSDTLTKVLVCLQASWMIMQCIARVARSIPLTLLEVHVMVNAICAFFMYLLWYHKPHDVMVATKVRVDEEKLKTLKDIVNGAGVKFKLTENRFISVGKSSCRLPISERRQVFQAVVVLLMTTVYGGIHLTVWKEHFPTNLERILWIASALYITLISFFTTSIAFVLWRASGKTFGLWHLHDTAGFFLDHMDGRRTWEKLFILFGSLLLIIATFLTPIFYFFARLYLLVEAFASLRSLPLGSYTAIPWISFFPHL